MNKIIYSFYPSLKKSLGNHPYQKIPDFSLILFAHTPMKEKTQKFGFTSLQGHFMDTR